MKCDGTNRQESSDQAPREAHDPSRRGFLVSAAVATAGPDPVEGMAVHSAEGPHRLLKFQRRFRFVIELPAA